MQEALLSSGFVELSCVVSIMAELEFNKGVVCLFLAFLSLLEISVISGERFEGLCDAPWPAPG